MKTLAPIILLIVALHYLFVACLSTHTAHHSYQGRVPVPVRAGRRVLGQSVQQLG